MEREENGASGVPSAAVDLFRSMGRQIAENVASRARLHELFAKLEIDVELDSLHPETVELYVRLTYGGGGRRK